MQCEVKTCEREAKTHKYGNLCLMHYKRFNRHGDFENHQEIISRNARERENAKCKFCDNKVGKCGAFGMCNKHYQMYHIHGDAMHFDGRKRPTSYGYYRTGEKGQAEHRKIYEDYYGIKLKSTQIIHHIDFNRTNNEIGNLWLFNSTSEHKRCHDNYRKLRKLYSPENIKFKNGEYIYES
mgnify:CR=1 FL=1